MVNEFEMILNYLRNDFQVIEDIKYLNQELFVGIMKQHKLITYITVSDIRMLSQEFATKVEQTRLEYKQRSAQIQCCIGELYQLTTDRGLDFAVIKGAALNYCLYGAEAIRTCGDLDILIEEEQANKFHELLVEQGFLQKKGPTSISVSRNRSSRAYTAFYAKQMKQYYLTMYPVRTHQNKPEYAPYCKDNFPCIELHDGMYFMNDPSVEKMLQEICIIDQKGYKLPSLNIPNMFITLLINTYENSESLYSNLYDNCIILRDYVDLKKFFDKYSDNEMWNEIEALIKIYEIEEIAGTILKNLEHVYAKDVTKGHLSSIRRRDSLWRINILDRMLNPEIARKAVLTVLREKWLEKGKQSKIAVSKVRENVELSKFQKCMTDDTVLFNIQKDNDCFILTWAIPIDRWERAAEYFYQFWIFPLDREVEYTVYKIDFCFWDQKCEAYGHKSKRYRQEAIRRRSGERYEVFTKVQENKVIMYIRVPFSNLKIKNLYKRESVCISAKLYTHYEAEIYYQCGEEKIFLLELGEDNE